MKTNADVIRSMTDDQLAHCLAGQCAVCVYQMTGCTEKECVEGVLKFLKQEASDVSETFLLGLNTLGW